MSIFQTGDSNSDTFKNPLHNLTSDSSLPTNGFEKKKEKTILNVLFWSKIYDGDAYDDDALKDHRMKWLFPCYLGSAEYCENLRKEQEHRLHDFISLKYNISNAVRKIDDFGVIEHIDNKSFSFIPIREINEEVLQILHCYRLTKEFEICYKFNGEEVESEHKPLDENMENTRSYEKEKNIMKEEEKVSIQKVEENNEDKESFKMLHGRNPSPEKREMEPNLNFYSSKIVELCD